MFDITKQFSLTGKVALVTGAAYGIGYAIAKAYADAGAKIAFNCRSQEHMDKALADYKKDGIEAHGYLCDVTDETSVREMVADIEKTLGTIDILVNNAGIIKRTPMLEMETTDFRQVIDIDLTAPFIVSKAVGNAVTRNLVRRRLKGIVEARIAAGLSGVDVVFRALPAAATAEFADLAAEVDRSLSRVVRDAGRAAV